MLKKILNISISASIFTAIIFASLGCNQTWLSNQDTEEINTYEQVLSYQESSCNCSIYEQKNEKHQTKSEQLDLKHTLVFSFSPQAKPIKTKDLKQEPESPKTYKPNPPPDKWIKTLARSQLQS